MGRGRASVGARSWWGPRAAVWRVRAFTVLLWLVVATGAVAGVAALAADRAPPPAEPVEVPTPPPAGVGGWAELFVASWLGAADGQELAGFLGRAVELPRRREQLYAARTTVVAVNEQAAGSWAVTVAAEVLRAGPQGWAPAGVRFFEVGVRDQDGQEGWVAAGLPAQVPAPTSPKPAPGMAGRLGRPDAGDAAQATAGRFLAALLAAHGELERYLAPDSHLRPVRPAPYVAVELARVAATDLGPDRRLLAVEVTAQTPQGEEQLLGYWLVLSRRDGRWEVKSAGGAPPATKVSEQRSRP